MALTLHFHPLASFCWKALIALYENDTPFTSNQVNLGDPTEREALRFQPRRLRGRALAVLRQQGRAVRRVQECQRLFGAAASAALCSRRGGMIGGALQLLRK